MFTLSDAKISIDQQNLNDLCDNIVANLPCYQCQVGTDAYQNTADADDFVDFFF